MQASVGFYSIMNSGLRSFEDVYRNDQNFSIFETELYDIDYKNFTFSSGFHLKLGWNWIQKKKYTIRQTTSLSAEIYREEVNFVLTDIGNGDSSVFNHYPQGIVNVGYDGKSVAPGLGWGATQEIVYLRNQESFSWGGGFSFTFRRRNDASFIGFPNSDVYVPNARTLTWGQYGTKQIGIVFHIEKTMNRGMIYLNINQQILTAKRQKGGDYFTDGNELNPVSHNMDFRFPLIIQFGGSLQFGKNKK